MSNVLTTMIQAALTAFEGSETITSFGSIRIKDGRVMAIFKFRDTRLAMIEVDPAQIVQSIIIAMEEEKEQIPQCAAQ